MLHPINGAHHAIVDSSNTSADPWKMEIDTIFNQEFNSFAERGHICAWNDHLKWNIKATFAHSFDSSTHAITDSLYAWEMFSFKGCIFSSKESDLTSGDTISNGIDAIRDSTNSSDHTWRHTTCHGICDRSNAVDCPWKCELDED